MGKDASEVKIKFWGVRGSVPSPGPTTARYGGNTSCVSVEARNAADGVERIAIFDSGTGIRRLGQHLVETQQEIILLLTHTHWDHIQGFPFFAPLYQAGRTIYLSRVERRRGLFRLLLEQMDGTRFPVTRDQIRSELDSHSRQYIRRQEILGYKVRRIIVNHPGCTYGFRLQIRDVAVVYIPDNELDPPYSPHLGFDKLAKFCRGADVLIHDAQYREEDMPRKRGWGHSVVNQVWELGLAAKVGHLVLFHHDPDRTDEELDALQEESRCWFAARNSPIRCTVAYEGLDIRLSSEKVSRKSRGKTRI